MTPPRDPGAKKPPGPANPRGEIRNPSSGILPQRDSRGNPPFVGDADLVPPKAPGPAVERLLWGWPEVLAATGIPRRTLEREIAAGRFPAPVRRVGRRPFFRPVDIVRWSEGGGRP